MLDLYLAFLGSSLRKGARNLFSDHNENPRLTLYVSAPSQQARYLWLNNSHFEIHLLPFVRHQVVPMIARVEIDSSLNTYTKHESVT